MTEKKSNRKFAEIMYNIAEYTQEDESPEAVLKTVSQWLEELPTEMEKLLKEKESVG
jgi:hypothetical protein